ncbi:hypothetical protein GXM_05641 [Nostoc sphaeroides CCNUC1]|uniref:Uncharacterized protein n=1 Tax=Nostoc sphaeroides CCNUC1 TaxID=2653204 RepID=A0A5P8W867_9NOSO|nr:hypothetical protein GXM_05641 [Nostoc sphaeroides CCNUC1]
MFISAPPVLLGLSRMLQDLSLMPLVKLVQTLCQFLLN